MFNLSHPIHRVSPNKVIVLRNFAAYRRHANNMMTWNFETAGSLQISKRQKLKVDGVVTTRPCWTFTFSSVADADKFVASMSRAKQMDEAIHGGGIGWIGKAWMGEAA